MGGAPQAPATDYTNQLLASQNARQWQQRRQIAKRQMQHQRTCSLSPSYRGGSTERQSEPNEWSPTPLPLMHLQPPLDVRCLTASIRTATPLREGTILLGSRSSTQTKQITFPTRALRSKDSAALEGRVPPNCIDRSSTRQHTIPPRAFMDVASLGVVTEMANMEAKEREEPRGVGQQMDALQTEKQIGCRASI